MAQVTIQLSDKALALVAQLQKEIFNRRRKKVSVAGVVETLVESGAKSQSDKRFATSWKNLITDIEKAAKVADAHGAKPANLTDSEWAMVLSHRTRAPKAPPARKPAAKKAPTRKPVAKAAAAKVQPAQAVALKPGASKKSAPKATTQKPVAKKPVAKKPAVKKPAVTKATASKPTVKKAAVKKPAVKKPASIPPSGNGAVVVNSL